MATTTTRWRDAFARHWPVHGDWQALPGELDLNFRDGRRVYKAMHPGCDPAVVSLQIDCLRHLHGHGLPVPAVVTDAAGADRRALSVDGEGDRQCWVISTLPGTVLARTSPLGEALVAQLGTTVAALHRRLGSFAHPALARTLKWDLREALTVRERAAHAASHPLHPLLERIFEHRALPALRALQALPSQPIHNDLNDYNILCAPGRDDGLSLTGIIDFGDMIAAPRVCDLAIAATYLMLQAGRPFDTLFAFVAAYSNRCALTSEELALLWPLVLTRMAVSAINAHESACAGHVDPYLQISQQAITRFLRTHAETPAEYVNAGLHRAAGLPTPGAAARRWIAENADHCFALFDRDLNEAPVLDLWIAGADAPEDPVAPDLRELDTRIGKLAPDGGPVLGRYREARLVYGAPSFLAGDHQASDRRTMHLAIDVFLPAGTALHAPLDGVVHSAEVCDQPFDYGGLVVLRHEPVPGTAFFTLYGHLSHASAAALQPGQPIGRGERFAALGEPVENGGWPPHVHFQLGLTEAPGSRWPGVVDPDALEDWQSVFPDPAPLLRLRGDRTTGREPAANDTIAQRRRHAPPSLKLSYRAPLQLVRGWRNLLFDAQGRTYLDAYNNVPHVGHSHPRLRRAIDAQLRWLNTNTRYLQPIYGEYTEALCARLPAPLSVCFLLSSGSEANELALRLARAHTGVRETIVLQSGYHGHTVAAIEISDYKFSGPGGEGCPDWVKVVPNPDPFRGSCPDHEGGQGAGFAEHVRRAVDALGRDGRRPGCFIAETFPSVGGQIVPPAGYLQRAYQHVRDAGGVCIADEVQTGLGRLGEYFWGFEQQQVVPDIVVLGKPLGNGYPLAAVITTPEIAASFDTGMEFFATFGGASVACAAGLEVLRIVDEERLAANAADVGRYLVAGLRALAEQHSLLADVRGVGLFVGVEIADERRQPLACAANYLVNRLRDRRVLIGSDGPDHNVLKIRPPLTFSRADADHLLAVLADTLHEAPLALMR